MKREHEKSRQNICPRVPSIEYHHVSCNYPSVTRPSADGGSLPSARYRSPARFSRIIRELCESSSRSASSHRDSRLRFGNESIDDLAIHANKTSLATKLLPGGRAISTKRINAPAPDIYAANAYRNDLQYAVFTFIGLKA